MTGWTSLGLCIPFHRRRRTTTTTTDCKHAQKQNNTVHPASDSVLHTAVECDRTSPHRQTEPDTTNENENENENDSGHIAHPVPAAPPPNIISTPPRTTPRAPLPPGWTVSTGRQPVNAGNEDAATHTPYARNPPPPLSQPMRPQPLPPIPRTPSLPHLLAPPPPLHKNALSTTSLRGSLATLRHTLRHPFAKSTPQLSNHTPTTPLRIFIATWNMNARVPTCDLAPLLRDPLPFSPQTTTTTTAPTSTPPTPHLVVIATQECEERLETAALRNPAEKRRWCAVMDTYLAPRYTCVKTKTLVGLHLAVYVKKEYVGMVTDIQTADTAVYLNGAKGCVAISLRLLLPPTTPTTTAPARSPTFCFLNAHLKAHEGAADRRNADWAKINHTLPLSPTPTTATPRTTPAGVVDRFDYTFWCGDLNYRTDMGPNRSPWARSLLEKPNPDIGVFIMNDELRKAYVAGTIFRHFSEAPIAFRPTFKFNVAKTQEPHPNPTPNLPHPPPPAHPAASSHLPGYDTSPKQRMPSYTDRILFKTRHPVNIGTTTPRGGESDSDSDPHHHPAPPRIPGLGAALNTSIHVDAYADVPGITHSDHKPVWGRYTVSDVEVPVCAEREGDDDDGGDPVAASSREKTCGAGAGWACGGVLNFWRRRQSRNAVQPVSE